MRIPAYWFCFTLLAGVICLLPIWYINVGGAPTKSLNILGVAYVLDSFEGTWCIATFIIHMASASALAIPVTIWAHFRSENDRSGTQFTITKIMALTAFYAMTIAAFQVLGFDVVYTLGVLFPLIGYAINAILIGKLERRARTVG